MHRIIHGHFPCVLISVHSVCVGPKCCQDVRKSKGSLASFFAKVATPKKSEQQQTKQPKPEEGVKAEQQTKQQQTKTEENVKSEQQPQQQQTKTEEGVKTEQQQQPLNTDEGVNASGGVKREREADGDEGSKRSRQ